MSARRRTWLCYGAAVVFGAAMLAWLTAALLRLERAEAAARAETGHLLRVGEGLWRMDTWLASLLAQEAARPWREYSALQVSADAYTNLLSPLPQGQVLMPSPLLTWSPTSLVRMHFQIAADGSVTSPQVPTGNALDLVQAQALGKPPALADRRTLLHEIAAAVSSPELLMRCTMQQDALPDLNPAAVEPPEQGKLNWSSNFAQRAQTTTLARVGQNAVGATAKTAEHCGPLLPVWITAASGEAHLLYVRRVSTDDGNLLQGFVVDWERLRQDLLARLADLELAGATLRRVEVAGEQHHRAMLATVPAALEVAPPAPDPAGWGRERTVLLLVWLAATVTAAAVALALRALMNLADRRARFASAVTHELRTPLTTFRLYTDMLQRGMVPDGERRAEYLATLHRESERLGRLVENVLQHARVEEGRFAATRRAHRIGDLVERHRDGLLRRAAEAGFELQIDVRDPDRTVHTDAEAVGQVLFNLVDNACKYGSGPVVLTADGDTIEVRDHGDGVPPEHRERVFTAFDRGSRQLGDNATPGVGLGLALARGLARELGGDLVLRDRNRFLLRLTR